MKSLLAVFLLFHVSSILNSQSPSASKMPEFTWDQIQLYFHGRKATAFNDTEIAYLAKFPLITLEKTTGNQTFLTTEEGSIQAARSIKAVNVAAKVLYYRNVMVHYGTYAVNSSIVNISEPFLKHRTTGEVLQLVGTNPGYDLSKATVRKWWVDHCVFMSNQPEIDGVFVDGNVKAITPTYFLSELGQTKKTQILNGYNLMMDSLKSALNPQKLNFANLIRATLDDSGLGYMHYFDGSYIENFIGNKEYIAKGIEAAQTVARQNKLLTFTFFITDNLPTEIPTDANGNVILSHEHQALFDFYLAIYLICAEKYSYFLVTENYDVNPGKNRFWMKQFAEYSKPLGSPKGDASKNGFIYTREFEHASVRLDLNTMSGTINWYSNPSTVTQTAQRNITIRTGINKLFLTADTGQHIKLYNLPGKVVWSGFIGSEVTEIPLPSGVYIIGDLRKMVII